MTIDNLDVIRYFHRRGIVGQNEPREAGISVDFEQPDLVLMRSHDADANAANASMALIEDWVRGRSYFLLLCVFRDKSLPTADARSRVHAWTQRVPLHAVAIVGPPFAIRIVVQMVIRAASKLRGAEILHHFAADEVAARAWLLEQRPVLERIVKQRDPTFTQ